MIEADAKRAKHRAYMRKWRRRHWKGWSFAAMCETVGFSSPQSSLDPVLWDRVESSYFEGYTKPLRYGREEAAGIDWMNRDLLRGSK